MRSRLFFIMVLLTLVALVGFIYNWLGAQKRMAREERSKYNRESRWREGHAPSFTTEDETTRM